MRQFTQEQTMFRAALRKFLETEISPHMDEYRKNGIVDRECFKKMGAQGFLLMWADERYGGLGLTDFRYDQIMIEEFSRARCGEFFATLHSRLVGPYIGHLGTQEQKDRFLPKCVSGETILALAMTEPGAGSDLAGMRTAVRDEGDHYILNGSKTYISNGINADVVIVAAKIDPENDPYAMVLLLVERGMEGFERGQNLEKMGLAAQDTAELFFNDVKIPKENVLGEPGKGFIHLMERLAEERLIAAVGCIATARKAFDVTREFVMERKLFKGTVADQQNTKFKMAEMDTEIESAEVFIEHCVGLHNEGLLDTNKAAKIKLLSNDVEWKMVDLGVQLHGAAGYMKEYEICQMFTGARINRILAGSTEVMKYIIGRDIFSQKYKSQMDS